MFEAFQKEQDAIVDEQITATQHYSEHYQTLSDADSLEYVNALLVRDKKMNDLRTRWLAKFQSIIPIGMAARAIQLDRHLGQVAQVQPSARIPLVH